MSNPRNRSKDERLKKLLDSAQLKAARLVRGLFLHPGDPGYNRDAECTKRDVSMKTVAAIELAKGSMAAERAKLASHGQVAVFGVVQVVPRMESASDWERLAAQVDRTGAIDVTETPAALPPKTPSDT